MAIEVIQLGVEVARRYPRVSQHTEYRELQWGLADQFRRYKLPIDEVGLAFQLDMESGQWDRKVDVEEIVLHASLSRAGVCWLGTRSSLTYCLLQRRKAGPDAS
jgi:hypothetical protein